MPLKLGSSGVCTGPQEGLQGQRDARFLGRGCHAPGWAGRRALFPPSLSHSVMGSEYHGGPAVSAPSCHSLPEAAPATCSGMSPQALCTNLHPLRCRWHRDALKCCSLRNSRPSKRVWVFPSQPPAFPSVLCSPSCVPYTDPPQPPLACLPVLSAPCRPQPQLASPDSTSPPSPPTSSQGSVNTTQFKCLISP